MHYIILNASVRRLLYTYIILTPHIEINLVTVQEAKIPVSICVGVVLSAYLLFCVRITKAVLQSIWPENGLIKVCECAGWSELGAQVKRLISLVSASCIRKIKLKCDRLYNAFDLKDLKHNAEVPKKDVVFIWVVEFNLHVFSSTDNLHLLHSLLYVKEPEYTSKSGKRGHLNCCLHGFTRNAYIL